MCAAKADIAMDGGQEEEEAEAEDPKFFRNSPSSSDIQAKAVSLFQATMPRRGGEKPLIYIRLPSFF